MLWPVAISYKIERLPGRGEEMIVREILIYVVDDDEHVRDSIESLLEAHGFTVLGFSSGETFLDHPRAARRSCLILDVEMPGLNGLEVLERICGDRLIAFTVLMTARPTARVRETVARAGVALLEKPFAPSHLVSTIMNGLRPGLLH